MSRLRSNVETVFDVFVEVAAPPDTESIKGSFILWKYPEDYDDQNFTHKILEFAFPCQMSNDSVQQFSFVLTGVDGSFTYGYARYTPRSKTCLCLLSALPWTSLFYRFLNHVADVMNSERPADVTALLVNAYHQEVPLPGETWSIESSLSRNKLEIKCPDHTRLPRIPDDPNMVEYYNAVDEEHMISIFASMLCERRIIFTCKKIKVLSACVMAANMLIFPMSWQHIFIPVLPSHLCEMLSAPIPFLIGVPKVSMETAIRCVDLQETVILDIDEKTIQSPFSDVDELPFEVVTVLRKNLRNSSQFGDGVARSFLRALVVLIGSYREALQFHQGEEITFDYDRFEQTRNTSIRPFLSKMKHLQIFAQFVEKRLNQLNLGEEIGDEFEEECRLYAGQDFNKYKYQYAAWKESLTGRFNLKEGEKVVKMLRTKTNTAQFQQAYVSVRNKSKDALRDFRDRFSDLKDDGPTFHQNAIPSASTGRSNIRDMMKNRSSRYNKPKEWTQSSVSMNPVDEVGTDAMGLPTSPAKSDINLVDEIQQYFDTKSASLIRESRSYEQLMDQSRSLTSSPLAAPSANDLFGGSRTSDERPSSSLAFVGIRPPPPCKPRLAGSGVSLANPSDVSDPQSSPFESSKPCFTLAGVDLALELFGDDIRESRASGPAAAAVTSAGGRQSTPAGQRGPSGGVQIGHFLNEFKDLNTDTKTQSSVGNGHLTSPAGTSTNTGSSLDTGPAGVIPSAQPSAIPPGHAHSPVTSPNDLIDLGPRNATKSPRTVWNYEDIEFDPLKISSTRSSAKTSSCNPSPVALRPVANHAPGGGVISPAVPSGGVAVPALRLPGNAASAPLHPGTVKTAVTRLRPGSNSNWYSPHIPGPGLASQAPLPQQRFQSAHRTTSHPVAGVSWGQPSGADLLIAANGPKVIGGVLPDKECGNQANGSAVFPALNDSRSSNVGKVLLPDGANWEQFE